MKRKIKLIFVLFILFGTYSFVFAKDNVITEVNGLIHNTARKYNLINLEVGIFINGIDTILTYGDANADNVSFLIGSNSKSFTALAILKLQEDGVLNIDDYVCKHITWFKYKNIDVSNQIRIRDLLNHTSGIPRRFGMIDPQNGEDVNNHYLTLLQRVVAPETRKFEYSNLNYQILGLVIEKVSGMSYKEFMIKNINMPLNLKGTNYSFNPDNNLIRSYQYMLFWPVLRKKEVFCDNLVSSGFISTTAEDMLVYLQALSSIINNDSVKNIGKESLEELFRPWNGSDRGYAMGWEADFQINNYLYYHDGLNPSFASSMGLLPRINAGFIILTNSNNSQATIELRRNITRLLLGEPIKVYNSVGFYIRNSLPLFVIFVLIIFIRLIYKWIMNKYQIIFAKRFSSILMLILGIMFGAFWVIYFPIQYNTPLKAILEYEPNSGYSLILLSIFIIINSIIQYFVRGNRELLKRRK